MSAATKTARQKAEHKLTWLKETAAYCESYIQLPSVNIPELQLPSKPIELSNNDIEELALQTRRHWGLGDGIISDLILLLEQKGVIVARSDLEASTLDALSEWNSADGRPYIYLSSAKESAARSRFDTAHELGHLIMHRHLDKKALSKPSEFKLIENQAHRFASAFLLPAETFAKKLVTPSLSAFLKLKEETNLSIGMMIKRAQDLSFVDEYEAKRLFINYSRRGWRKGEPFDDQVVPESPRLLQKIIHLLVNEKIITKSDIKKALPYRPADICQLAGLPIDYLDYEECVIEEFPSIKIKSNVSKPTGNTKDQSSVVVPFKNKK